MPPSGVTFKSVGGGSPTQSFIKLRKALTPTVEDVRFAGERQRARILDRTERLGIDVDKRAFAPYSETGPYYYYPNKTGGTASRKRSANRVRRQLGLRASRGRKPTPMGGVTPGGAIKFASYGAAKRAFGRGHVDLRGLPGGGGHMLNGILVQPRDRLNLVIGVYGEKALLAAGHNIGAGRLPRRWWFGTSKDELRQMGRDILDHMAARTRRT